MHQARPWGVFRDDGDFYICDYTGPPFAFTNYRSIGLSGDDICILPTGEYWRCENGSVYFGTIGTDEVTSSEDTCTGFSAAQVRSLDAWKNNDNTYGIIYAWDADPNDDGVQGQIRQASSTDGIVWTGHSTIMTQEKCDEQALVYESNQNMNHGSFESDDMYALEKLDTAIEVSGNSYKLRMFRIGRKNRYDGSGNFSDYVGWTALGRVVGLLEDSIEFVEEADFTVQGKNLAGGGIQIIQVIRT